MAGRLVWSSTSDLIGRKNMYRVYLGVGALLYLVIALAGDCSTPLFIVCALGILSFYGGGFATVPAYLKDLFGTYQVGAIHGRLLTAWSTAGVLGPLIVNCVADAQEAAGPVRARPVHDVPVHHDRAARDRLRRQRADPPGAREVPRASRGPRGHDRKE